MTTVHGPAFERFEHRVRLGRRVAAQVIMITDPESAVITTDATITPHAIITSRHEPSLIGALTPGLLAAAAAAVGVHEPSDVRVAAGEPLHGGPEFGGARLHLHGARYVNDLDPFIGGRPPPRRALRLPAVGDLLAGVVDAKHVHLQRRKISNESRNLTTKGSFTRRCIVAGVFEQGLKRVEGGLYIMMAGQGPVEKKRFSGCFGEGDVRREREREMSRREERRGEETGGSEKIGRAHV